MGINAVTASTGEEGLVKVRQHVFDLIFVDINLPDINGLELLNNIQECSLFSKIIVITSEINEEYRQTAISKGAVDFIEKPFGFSEIKKLVNSIFSDCVEKRECQRFTCSMPCNLSVLKITDAGVEDTQDVNNLYGTAVDISKKGLGLRFKNDITGIAKGNFVRVLTGVRDHSIFDFLPSNIVAEIIWVKEQGREILAGLKYLKSNDLDRLFKA